MSCSGEKTYSAYYKSRSSPVHLKTQLTLYIHISWKRPVQEKEGKLKWLWIIIISLRCLSKDTGVGHRLKSAPDFSTFPFPPPLHWTYQQYSACCLNLTRSAPPTKVSDSDRPRESSTRHETCADPGDFSAWEFDSAAGPTTEHRLSPYGWRKPR